MAQYYTLEEAARVLQLSQDEVKKMAEEKKVRSFRDRGTLRFRAQDIDELARNLGLGSDPDLQLGEVPPPKKTSSPTPARKPKGGEDDVFDFKLGVDDDQVEIGQEMKPPSGGSKAGGSSAARGKTPGPRSPSPRSPAPKPGSDSDVRLVPDAGSQVGPSLPEDAKSGSSARGQGKKASKLGAPDSGVRIVPLDSDSDVKMELDSSDENVSLGSGKPKSASDSDIRIEQSRRSGKGEAGPVTEEIDLDAEMSSKQGPSSGSTRKPTPAKGDSSSGGHAALPSGSPFELSDDDLELEPKGGSKGGSKKGSKSTQHKSPTDSSDDFRLSSPTEQSPLELGSDEVPALDDEVSLGELNAGAGHSGINLKDPADSGISLEQEGSDELEVPLDAGNTPRPARGKAKKPDSDSEFELSLDDPSDDTSGDSSFELSLEGAESSVELEAVGGGDSDSEFELTLDDSGASSPLEASGERDIFETDFEVPALDEDSGSAVAPLDEDTDLESSDFDLALSDEDMVQSDDESSSQVVTLDEEADDAAATVQRKKPKTKVSKLARDEDDDDDSPWSGVTDEEDEDAETVPGKVRVEYRDTPATPWGAMPALLMIPCVLVLFVVGLMGFEVIQGMIGYRKGSKATGLVVRPLTEAITGETLPGSPAKK